MEAKKILIAEDNISNYKLLEFVLSKEYQIFHAFNGKEAVEKFMQLQPDLIIMDIDMPVMDGNEATMRIREMSTTIPIIGLTAYAYSTDQEKGLESGMNKYFTKPTNMKVLREAIKEMLGE